MLSAELLDVLCCPADRSSIRLATPEEVATINERIARGVRNNGGAIVEGTVDGALIRADGTYAYPIREGIPVMLIDEAIPLAEGAPRLVYQPPPIFRA
jgi:uncharacterized protein YbaR (Trm112 family)